MTAQALKWRWTRHRSSVLPERQTNGWPSTNSSCICGTHKESCLPVRSCLGTIAWTRNIWQYSKSQKWWTYKPLLCTVHLRVFSWPTRLPMEGESIAKVPNKTAAKWAKCFSSFFRRASSTLRQPLALVYARNSSTLYWAVHKPVTFSQLRSLTRHCSHSL